MYEGVGLPINTCTDVCTVLYVVPSGTTYIHFYVHQSGHRARSMHGWDVHMRAGGGIDRGIKMAKTTSTVLLFFISEFLVTR